MLHDTSEQELRRLHRQHQPASIVPLPAGGLDFALGYEHRKQSGFYQPDAIYPANESAGVPSGPTSGQYDTLMRSTAKYRFRFRRVPGADLAASERGSALVRLLDVRKRYDQQVRPQPGVQCKMC